SYVDASRIGIWGWSYGGYMTLYAMTNSDAFKAGISVAPVTDWRNYDTAYTERYMGLPSENEEGYKTSAPSHTAENLSGRLLLVHGTGDDNVHMQNAIHMADKLIDAGIDFDMMFYPNQKHGIASDRNHLFKKMTSFLEQYLPVNAD
ncbi:MAG: S9 family peptidase, partial [Calditrichota bacterium]